MERLQKVIANSGYTSRRKAEELITKGKVVVNGEVVKELGTKVSDKDIILVEGVEINKQVKKVYYLLNKPRGFICSLSDEKGRKTVDTLINELDSAEIIVAGGMGLKNKDGFALLKRFADKIGGTVAATRSAVEAGLAPRSIQVGQTGKTVHPKIYIACGISGAIQHTVGMEDSGYIIAINKDPDAQIFEIAD